MKVIKIDVYGNIHVNNTSQKVERETRDVEQSRMKIVMHIRSFNDIVIDWVYHLITNYIIDIEIVCLHGEYPSFINEDYSREFRWHCQTFPTSVLFISSCAHHWLLKMNVINNKIMIYRSFPSLLNLIIIQYNVDEDIVNENPSLFNRNFSSLNDWLMIFSFLFSIVWSANWS